MMRDATDWELMTPYPALTDVPGLVNCAVLSALKNSVRNSSVASSRKPPTRVFLSIEISQLNWAGPSRNARLVLPKPDAPAEAGFVPLAANAPSTGKGHAAEPFVTAVSATADRLKKLLNLDSTLPGFTRLA